MKEMHSVILKSGLTRFAAVLAATVTSAAVITPHASADTANQTGFAVAYVSGGLLKVWGCT